MRVTYIASGAAGMYCGSCLRDNALVRELRALGCEVRFVPFYTPIRTDEDDVSDDALLFGGVSVYLEQKSTIFRYLPRFLTRWMDRPGFVRRLSQKGSIKNQAADLGELTLSMLLGEHGRQRREVEDAIQWMERSAKPDLINLTNLFIAGFIPSLKQRLHVPVVATLQGDDQFLHHLDENYRAKVLDELRRLAGHIDGFVTFSQSYADQMAELLDAPREKLHVVPLGIDPGDFTAITRTEDRPPTIGYFGRIAPEKGFGQLVDAFICVHRKLGRSEVTFRAGGWLGKSDEPFFEAQKSKLIQEGLGEKFEYIGSPERAEKIDFFRSIDVFSLPTQHEEPKGLSVLEAMAAGVPVVQPRVGCFPEMLAETGGGVLCPPGNPGALASELVKILESPDRGNALGEKGRAGVMEKRHASRMAEETLKLYRYYAGR